MNCAVLLMATIDLKRKDAIDPGSGMSPNGMVPYHIFCLLILSASVHLSVQRCAGVSVWASECAWSGLKAGIHSERKGVTYLILLLTFPSPGVFRCLNCQ